MRHLHYAFRGPISDNSRIQAQAGVAASPALSHATAKEEAMTDETSPQAIDTSVQDSANTDRFAAQLKQDVRSWTARDNDATDRAADATLVMAAKAAKAATTRKRAKPAAKVAAPVESAKGRPFSMSYEGVSNAQYLAGRIARGAR
jgi:hypothetical protein